MPVESLIITLAIVALAGGAIWALVAFNHRLMNLVEYMATRGDIYDQDALVAEIMEGIGIAADADNLGDDERQDPDRR